MSGEGTVAITTSEGQVKLLHKVHYVPNLAYNLLSVNQLIFSGYSALFSNQACYIKDAKTGQLVIKVQMTTNKMFPLDIAQMENYGLVSKELNTSILWHLSYGHLSEKGLKLLHKKEIVFGLPQMDQLEVCEACIYRKQNRRAFPGSANWRDSSQLELIHADVCGPMQMASLEGNKYYLLFTDDYTHMSWVYFIKYKS